MVSFGRMRSAAMNTIGGNVLPIAIDFGASSLKVLQLCGGESTTLVAAACLATPEDFLTDAARRFEFQFKALPRLIKSVGFKGKRAVCAIPAAQTFCKHMQFPRADNVDLAELVRQAVPAALECASEALVYRHVAVVGATPAGAVVGSSTQGMPAPGAPGSGGAKQEVICLAASRHFVGQIMASIREAKLEPVGMHPECFATVKAFEQINRRESDRSVGTLYIDLAYGTSKVWVCHGNDLVFAKTIAVGGRDLDHAVSRSADCDLASARAKRLNAAVLVAEPRRPNTIAPSAASTPTPGGLAMLAAAMAKAAPVAPSPTSAPTGTAEDRREGSLAPGFSTDVASVMPMRSRFRLRLSERGKDRGIKNSPGNTGAHPCMDEPVVVPCITIE